jgi:ABC-type transport system substrate-binding protein
MEAPTGDTTGGTTGGDTGDTTGGTGDQGGAGGSRQGGPIPAGTVLDPIAATSDSEEVTSMLYDGLVEADADGNITGALADRWTVSEDGLTYIFYLRPGLTSRMGRLLTPMQSSLTSTAGSIR